MAKKTATQGGRVMRLEEDIYGDEDRGIDGLINRMEKQEIFQKSVLDFQNEVRGMIKGAKWAFGAVFGILGLIAYLLTTLRVQVSVVGQQEGSAGAQVVEASPVLGVTASAPIIDLQEPLEQVEDAVRLLSPLDLILEMLP